MKKNQTSTPLFITLLMIAFAVVATAQTARIKGQVKTSDGKAAAFVNILLEGTNQGTTTNESGYYEISNLKSGDYTIITTFIGLQAQTQNVKLTEATPLELNFTLKENSQELSEVIVRGQQSANETVVGVGKIGIRPMDLPQSVAVLSQKILEQQQVLRLSDALMNMTGVYIMGASGGYQEEIAGRGYPFTSSNTFKNGVRYNNSILPELSALEKVEFMKGSGAILFGNVAAGGVLNLVTKKPKWEQGGSLSMRMGSFGFYKPSLDVYGSVNPLKNVAYRVHTTYEKANSFRTGVSSERFYINPSLLVKIGAKTDILLEGDFLKDERTPDFGVGAIDYAIADVPRTQYIGVAWAKYKAEQKSATLTWTHHLNDHWQLKGATSVQAYETSLFANTRPNSNGNLVQTNGKWIRGLAKTNLEDDYYMGQLDLTGRFKIKSINNQILVGLDAEQYNTKTTAFTTLLKYDSIHIFNPTLYKSRNDIPDLAKATLTLAPIARFGIYAQDLISLGSKIKLLLGLRYTYQKTHNDILTYSTDKSVVTDYSDAAFSPRLGLVYQPIQQTSLFASYSNSFVLNTGTDLKGNSIAASSIDQYEMGIKNELFNGLLSANVTFYQITNDNLAQTDFSLGNTNTNIKTLGGAVQSKGVEVDLRTKTYQGFSAIAGYSYNDTRYTKSNIFIVGSRLRYNPQHTANASLFYSFQQILNGLQLGFTTLYVGERVAGRSTRLTVANDSYKLMPIPNYMQFDVSVNYHFNQLALRLKVANLWDKLSYNVHDDNSVNPIAPRNYAVTMSYTF
jgi:iron complex outermembrane recepter protein